MSACNTAPWTTSEVQTSLGITGEEEVQRGLDVRKEKVETTTESVEPSPHNDLDDGLDGEDSAIFGSDESSTSSSSSSSCSSSPERTSPAEPAPIITRRRRKTTTARCLFNGKRKRGQNDIPTVLREMRASDERHRERMERMNEQYELWLEDAREARRHENEIHRKHMEETADFNQRFLAILNQIVQGFEDRHNSS